LSRGGVTGLFRAKLHADARFTESQRTELTDWLDAEAVRLDLTTGK
jgi:hypothetical protein